ncbi:hypothetical protein Apa02nite_091790 [Actinoplanes palleronii]|uniref:Uncharacterized protein n=1 Tax=Actinoplanes palleronii TaxID=113570 RepID=A0ABQ4BQW9_9ACTN|nr:hypothetical protein Apa02nite_091790 [Actinoplanes palleronii]
MTKQHRAYPLARKALLSRDFLRFTDCSRTVAVVVDPLAAVTCPPFMHSGVPPADEGYFEPRTAADDAGCDHPEDSASRRTPWTGFSADPQATEIVRAGAAREASTDRCTEQEKSPGGAAAADPVIATDAGSRCLRLTDGAPRPGWPIVFTA